MSALTRYTQLIFGSSDGNSDFAQFGSLAAGTPTLYAGNAVTPANVQALSNFLTGWTGAVVGNHSPQIEDLNSLCFLFAYQLAYLMERGVAEWDSATTYYVGDIVQSAGVLYRCIQTANLNHAVTLAAWWGSVDGNVQTKNVDYSVLASDKLVIMGTAKAATLPSAAAVLGKEFEIVNGDGTAVTVATVSSQTISGSASPYALGEQYGYLKVRSDGSNYYIVGAG